MPTTGTIDFSGNNIGVEQIMDVLKNMIESALDAEDMLHMNLEFRTVIQESDVESFNKRMDEIQRQSNRHSQWLAKADFFTEHEVEKGVGIHLRISAKFVRKT